MEHRLLPDHDGQNHRGDHRHAAVEQHGHHHREERHEDDFGVRRIEPRDQSRLRQQDREQSADQRDLAQIAVRLAPVEHQQHPEDHDDQGVAEQRTDDAADRVGRRGAAAEQLLVQRHEALVGLVRYDFVRAHDPIAGAHDVFARIDAAPQLVAAPLRFQRFGNQGRPEELPLELDVQHVTHARAGIGVQRLGAVQVLVERQRLIAQHGRFRGAASHDQLARLFALEDTGPCDALGEGTVEQSLERLLQPLPFPALAEIGCLLGRQ